jgi:tight adherence protein B
VNLAVGLRRVGLPAVACVLVALLALPAFAQADPQVRLSDAQLSADGTTRLIVNVDGLGGSRLEPDAFRVLEGGQPVDELDVEAAVESEIEADAIAAMLLLDVSSSMAGEPLERIKTAAADTARTLNAEGIEVGVVTFDEEVNVLAAPTLDTDALVTRIEDIDLGFGTALYDAVLTSVDLLDDFEGSGTLVVFADGQDNRSDATIDDVIAASDEAAIPLTMVVLETDVLDLSVLEPLATETNGRLISVTETGALEGVFGVIAQDITSQYVIRYWSDVLEPAELPVSVIVDTPAGEARVDSLAINSREEFAIAPPSPPPSVFDPRLPFLTTTTGLWVGIGAAFLAALALLWVVLVSTRRTAGSRTLERGLRAMGHGSPGRRGEDVELPTARITERAIDLVGRVPRPRGFDDRLQLQLDRAAWPVRTNEFLVLCIASALLGGLLAGGAAGNVLLGLLAMALAGAAPMLVVRIRIERRKRAFMEQLPGTLQLLAGSLRAGYGLLQALDTVVKEADDPTAAEFARVLTEARLGMPIDEALEGMSQRLDSEDFHWVVLAIGIQREVGGNLAELLTTVAGTMRGRATLRRQIRVLSAEGRISAWVVGVMPFFVAFALQLINPGYLNELFTRSAGLVMLAVGVGLLLAGAFWLKKIVDIEV